MEIPGTGQATTIPIRLSLDLYEFFGNKGYDELVGLALAIGGRSGSPSRLTLDAQPRVTTPFGEIVYPGRITIVDREFTDPGPSAGRPAVRGFRIRDRRPSRR